MSDSEDEAPPVVEEIEANIENESAEPEEKEPEPPKKKVVRRPQPKLNDEALKSKKGLLALPQHFERVKFRGRGHEVDDLNVIMKTYEYWCHRLFPKFPFEDSVAKIEKLGSKRGVLTYMKRIRLDMVEEDPPPLLEEGLDDERPLGDLFEPLNVGAPEPPEGVNDDLLERIRMNRERAERIRMEKLRIQSTALENRGPYTQISDTQVSTNEYLEETEVGNTESAVSQEDIGGETEEMEVGSPGT